MIQPQELRIKNIVSIDGVMIKVRSITKDKIGYYHAKRFWYEYEFKDFEPIPLSEELLFKSGFELVKVPTEIKDFHIEYYKKGIFVVYLLKDHFEVELINKVGEQFNLFKIFKKQLHKLQNIYYEIEGEELQITL